MFDFLFQHRKRSISEKVIYVQDHQQIEYSSFDDYITRADFSFWGLERIGHDAKLLDIYVIRNLEYSKYYRKMMKENDVDTIVRLLTEESPTFAGAVDTEMLKNNLSELKKKMSDITIIRLPATATLKIGKVTYHGAKELKSASKDKRRHVSDRWERFPCFDSDDYSSEDRCYNNYCFCPKDSEMWGKVQELIYRDSNACVVGEGMPADVLPMVYMNDEEETMLFAYK